MKDLINYMRAEVAHTEGQDRAICYKVLQVLKKEDKRRKALRKLHRTMITTLTVIAATMFIFGVLTADSESNIPIIMMCVSSLWLALVAYANS